MPSDTYKSTDTGRASNSELYYDAKTGKWKQISTNSSSNTTKNVSEMRQEMFKTKSEKPSSTEKDSTVVTTNPKSKVKSKVKADKKYIEEEYNTLEGELNLVPTSKTIRIEVGQTIKIKGVGKFLSGLYYVSAVKRTIDKDSGYSISLTVIKTGFGSSLKKVSTTVTNKDVVKKDASPKLDIGDKVMFLSVDGEYTYSNASEGVRVPNWVKKKTHTVDGLSSDGTRVRLKEIWSWTYVKYLKKV